MKIEKPFCNILDREHLSKLAHKISVETLSPIHFHYVHIYSTARHFKKALRNRTARRFLIYVDPVKFKRYGLPNELEDIKSHGLNPEKYLWEGPGFPVYAKPLS